ncbi:MAG: hypothetical protein ABIJ15_09320 [bacterium]
MPYCPHCEEYYDDDCCPICGHPHDCECEEDKDKDEVEPGDS